MSDQRANTFDDDDMRQILGEIEGMEAEKVSIRAKAAGECGGVTKQIANAKTRAKELGIPLAILNGLIKTRKLERQIEAVADNIPEDFVVLFEESSGQFSIFAPEGDEPHEPVETTVQAAAKKRADKVKASQEAEQVEGAAVLDKLTQH